MSKLDELCDYVMHPDNGLGARIKDVKDELSSLRYEMRSHTTVSDHRFQAVRDEFEEKTKSLRKELDSINKKRDDDKNRLKWFIGIGVSFLGVVATALKVLMG